MNISRTLKMNSTEKTDLQKGELCDLITEDYIVPVEFIEKEEGSNPRYRLNPCFSGEYLEHFLSEDFTSEPVYVPNLSLIPANEFFIPCSEAKLIPRGRWGGFETVEYIAKLFKELVPKKREEFLKGSDPDYFYAYQTYYGESSDTDAWGTAYYGGFPDRKITEINNWIYFDKLISIDAPFFTPNKVELKESGNFAILGGIIKLPDDYTGNMLPRSKRPRRVIFHPLTITKYLKSSIEVGDSIVCLPLTSPFNNTLFLYDGECTPRPGLPFFRASGYLSNPVKKIIKEKKEKFVGKSVEDIVQHLYQKLDE